jgi:hypothetical protein
MNLFISVIPIVGFLFILAFSSNVLWTLVVRYEIGEKKLAIRLLGVKVWHASIGDVEAELVGWSQLIPFGRGRPRPSFWISIKSKWITKTAVWLKKPTGLIRNVIITPDDPADFIRQITHKKSLVSLDSNVPD